MMRPALSPLRARTLAGVGALGAAVLLSSCQSLSEQTTDLKYDAGDGVSATVGALQLSNVLLVTTGKGKPGEMHGMVTNNGSTAAQLQVTPAGSTPATISVPPLTAVRLDGQASGDAAAGGSGVKVPSVSADPGRMVQVTFSTGRSGSSAVQVPVLLDQYPYGTATLTHEPDGTASQPGDVGEEAGSGSEH
ncbi:hypothetical protein [Luteipulveratus flavus]|uniref:Lipoprotein n=1 Tax=Luteipulveratus flavus TaxID=3031728 RepID=A0ABT6CE28_9MICO|nr:hypothetical protein [Luteipulveratus sp. YIM 133296]MDF8265541.1 hypothetical protein [Luteipulveratus sp. YIM 133296]